MTVKERVLALLDSSKGDYVSGEQIATQLSVTRSAIWKAIKTLQAEGYQISAVTNKGYSLSAQTDILSARAIEKYLTGSALDLRLEVFKSLSSTNHTAKELASDGEAEGKVILSEEQTAGRGRAGKSFFSPSGTGLYMSILLRPKMPAAESSLLTTAAAVAVARAIERVSGRQAQIKWVNDVFVEGKKVCGILTEAALSVESGGLDYAVVGIGINIFEPFGGFPPELSEIITSVLTQNGKNGDIRSRIAAEVLSEFMGFYDELDKKRFLLEYKRRSFILGKEIMVITGSESRRALALELDDDCRLKVRYEDEREEYLSSGEISVKI